MGGYFQNLRAFKAITAFAALLSIVSISALAQASSGHAGYYYPENFTREQYVSKAQTIPQATRESRLAFVAGVSKSAAERNYPPQRAMFAKGEFAQKLIIVSLYEDHMSTLTQARAVLALMTNVARTTKILRELQVESIFNFLDFLKMLGFTELTISDGKDYAHKFLIE